MAFGRQDTSHQSGSGNMPGRDSRGSSARPEETVTDPAGRAASIGSRPVSDSRNSRYSRKNFRRIQGGGATLRVDPAHRHLVGIADHHIVGVIESFKNNRRDRTENIDPLLSPAQRKDIKDNLAGHLAIHIDDPDLPGLNAVTTQRSRPEAMGLIGHIGDKLVQEEQKDTAFEGCTTFYADALREVGIILYGHFNKQFDLKLPQLDENDFFAFNSKHLTAMKLLLSGATRIDPRQLTSLQELAAFKGLEGKKFTR